MKNPGPASAKWFIVECVQRKRLASLALALAVAAHTNPGPVKVSMSIGTVQIDNGIKGIAKLIRKMKKRK